MKTQFTKLIVLSAALAAGSASAATVAIIDSGTDLLHAELSAKKWQNPKEVDDAVDNDDNGYIDDLNGWNFAEDNNKLIDRQFLGKFSPDVYKFFEIQTKNLKGEATTEDLAWVKAKREDKAFLAQLGTFGNFVHGTHVAGISAVESAGARIMPIKLLPTKAPGGLAAQTLLKLAPNLLQDDEEKANKLLLAGLARLGQQQSQIFTPISAYLKGENARVANCSFGTSYTQVRAVLKPLVAQILKREPTDAELDLYAKTMIGGVLKGSTKSLAAASPNTLFVMAAGNDGTDNDVYPMSPANIRLANTLTVAATRDNRALATFSNYGKTMVDLAAPGVGIRAAIPGGQWIALSGTSQAAPAVTNVAGRLFDTNPKLSITDVKRILTGTVDAKDFLKGKVASGGLLNAERALAAATLSLTMPVEAAIARATNEVRDAVETSMFGEDGEVFALPLPTLF